MKILFIKEKRCESGIEGISIYLLNIINTGVQNIFIYKIFVCAIYMTKMKQ